MNTERPKLAAVLLLSCIPLAACRSNPPKEQPAKNPAAKAPADLPDSDWELDFVGNDTYSARELKRQITDELTEFEKGGLRAADADDVAFTLEAFLISRGFYQALVRSDIEEKQGVTHLKLTIKEGPRPEVVGIEFNGNTVFTGEQLTALFEGPRAGLLGGGNLYLVMDEISQGARAIESLYLGSGYLAVIVEKPSIQFDDQNRRARVRVNIEEGRHFQVGEISIAGDLGRSEAELRTAISSFAAQSFHPQLTHEMRSRLLAFLEENGYPDTSIEIKPSIDEELGLVHLDLSIEAGPIVTIGEVVVEGNERTRDAMIKRRVELQAGDLYQRSLVRDSFQRLFGTGLFRTLSINLEKTPAVERDLIVQVKENKAREIFIEPGWGSYELLRIKFGYRDRNLAGLGLGLRAEAVASIRHQEVEFGVSDPFFLGHDVFADASVFATRRQEPSFRREAIGFEQTVARYWTESVGTAMTYKFEHTKARDVEVVDASVLAAQEDLDISSLEFSVQIDTRDSRLNPTKGHQSRFAVEWGDETLGSELDFLRVRLRVVQWIPIGTENVLGFGLRMGAIAPIRGEDTIPLQERFFNGGQSTVRSFQQDELGPLDANDEPVGGEAFSVLTAEWRHQLTGNLSAAFFTDVGNVEAEYEKTLRFQDIRYAVGAGVRYLLPIGPVRLDLGVNPNPRDGEDDFAVHFSVGLAF